MVLSVPHEVEQRRVSVDAIEHWMIYQEHPGVGAIIHVHAWVDGIEATDVNYPCGTEELAKAVADLVRAEDDPDNAVVGLRNHGITVTGPSLEEIKEAGRRLGDLDLLPAPFPIEDLLDERDLRQVKRLYGIGGLSYGNLSMRKDEQRFWMSASGVDKSNLETAGRDILLVSDYDEENGRMVLSVPPGVEPRRVSVDAIEHWMIYQAHPDVGAILHVHAWMEGIQATDINYPCGTHELAIAVADLLALEPDPAHAVIGLRNHGITATGEGLFEILDRIEPNVLRQVPMM
jgi:ribulose-5-phosphate 4-epimerase/fuculose-1-phosphate aldolase